MSSPAHVPVLAPEATDGLRAAQDALEHEAARLAVMSDPIAPVLSAMAVTTGAMNRLMIDATLTIQAQQQAIDQAIQDGRKPWTPAEMGALINQLDQTLLHRWTQFNRAGIAVGVGVALLLAGLAFGGGAYWYAKTERQSAVTNCLPSPQTSGEAWNCTFWTRFPTPGQR